MCEGGGSLGWGGMGVGPFELNSRFGRPKTKIYVVLDTHTIFVTYCCYFQYKKKYHHIIKRRWQLRY